MDQVDGMRAKKRRRTDSHFGHGGPVDAAEQPQGSPSLLGEGSKKRKGIGRRKEDAVPSGAEAHSQGIENTVAGLLVTRRGSERREHSGPKQTAAHSRVSEGMGPGGIGGNTWTADVFPLLELPAEVRGLVLGHIPLRDLARLACLSKALRSTYRERVRTRDAAVADLLASRFTAEFREGLSPAQTALPYDLIVHPQMDPLLQAAPEACRLVSGERGPWACYEGFCMARRADEGGDSECRGGEQCEGGWRVEDCHGHGIVQYTASHYVGEWKAKRPHGFATLVDASGTSYEGEWREGKRHGRGTYRRTDGTVHVGDWEEGRCHGQGTRVFPTGDKYEGDWCEGIRHGQGTLTWADGGTYVGSWSADQYHGHGTRSGGGQRYEGEWREGLFHGHGTRRWADGRTYVGEWKAGRCEGKGTLVYPCGATYEGEWRGGKYHGRGTLTLADGLRKVGLWEAGRHLGYTLRRQRP